MTQHGKEGHRGLARFCCASILFLAASFLAGAQSAATKPEIAVPGKPYYKALPNGLDIIVLPLPSVDRVSISLVFRGGAEGQGAKTAGYPSLAEGVLFRGTVTNPGEPEPAGAVDALAPLSLSGGTGEDRFSIGFTLAPEMLGQGLDTLAYLLSEVRQDSAFSDAAAIQEAKSALLARIALEMEDPGAIYEAAQNKKLFSTAPWRLDPSGAPSLVQAASSEGLKAYAAAWLCPNNAVLVMAGSLDAEASFQAAESAFASWKKSADPWKIQPAAFPKPGVTRPTLLVYPDPSVPKGEAYIEMRYRGPDSPSARSIQAELWAELADKPGSRLNKAIVSGMPSWSAPALAEIRYEASRFASWFSLSTKIGLSAKGNPADAAMSFKEIVRGAEMYALKSNPSYFTAKDLEAGKSSLREEKAAILAEPETAVLWLADRWVQGGWSWVEGWESRLGTVVGKDLSAFSDEYFMKNLETIALRLAPEEYAARKKGIDSYGFNLIVSEKAFWWQ
jgi:predicted Zn-dependent peptidase